MTPTDEARFIELWNQGASYRDIAQALGCPLGTVASRSAALAAQGKIQSRPRGGGTYASRRAQAGQEDPPEPHPRPPAPQAPAPTRDPPAAPTHETPAITFMAVPEVRELIHTVTDLVARVAALEETTRDGTRTPPAPASPPAGTRTPGTIKQWTVRLSQPLIEAVKARAVAEGKEPSHVVEQLLWQGLGDRPASTPDPTIQEAITGATRRLAAGEDLTTVAAEAYEVVEDQAGVS